MPHVRAPISGPVGRTGANRGAAHPANAASVARIRAGAGGAVDGGVGQAVTTRTEYRAGLLRDGRAVMEHFIASQTEGARWPEETIEIEASPPKLKKTGSRRLDLRMMRFCGQLQIRG